MWILEAEEPRGMMKNKVWLKNTENNRRALFKPDTEENESEKSIVFYQVCSHLGVSCAKTELFEYEGKKGCLSYDVGHRRLIANEGAELDIKIGSSLKDDVSYAEIESMILDSVKIKFADMVYVDVLLRNIDRHSGNFKLLMNKNKQIVDLLGLYDNDQILGEELSELSYFRWDTEVSEPLYDVIKKPHGVFPGRIKELLAKSVSLPVTINYYDKIMERLINICNSLEQDEYRSLAENNLLDYSKNNINKIKS